MNIERDWVDCPVCGEPDMRQETEDFNKIISCTNSACASNGGDNYTMLAAPPEPKDLTLGAWERRTGIPRHILFKCMDIMTDIVNNNKKNEHGQTRNPDREN